MVGLSSRYNISEYKLYLMLVKLLNIKIILCINICFINSTLKYLVTDIVKVPLLMNFNYIIRKNKCIYNFSKT